MDKWLSVDNIKPPCKRDTNAFGTPVLIWPRDGGKGKHSGVDGMAYYGRRATGKPCFYLYGARLDVTHWMPLPKGPKKERSK